MSDLRLLASALLLSGGMAAAVAAATLRYGVDEPPRIASVRLGEITAAYTTRAAEQGRSAEDVRAWGAALEAALDRVAKRHATVLLPARAVAAGAPDLTARKSRRRSRSYWRIGVRRNDSEADAIHAEDGRGRAGAGIWASPSWSCWRPLWLGAASRVHVNASWSDGAWGYAALPLLGRDPKMGDRVLFEPRRNVMGSPCAVSQDRAWRAGHARCGRAGRNGVSGRPAGGPRQGPRARRAARSGRSRPAPSRRGITTCTPNTGTATTAAMPRSALYRARTLISGRAIALPNLPWLGLDIPLARPEDVRVSVILPLPVEGPDQRDRGDLEADGNGLPEAAR